MNRSGTIVWMDDSVEVLNTIRMVLSFNGYEHISLFADKRGGYDWVAEHSACLLGFDLASPDMTGWHLLALLKAGPMTRNIPCICLTGAPSIAHSRRELLRAGVVSILSKPCQINDIAFAVDEALGFNRIRQQSTENQMADVVPFLPWSRVSAIWRLMLADLGSSVVHIDEQHPWCLDFLLARDDQRIAGRVLRPCDINGALAPELNAFADCLARSSAQTGYLFPLFDLVSDREPVQVVRNIHVVRSSVTAHIMRNTRHAYLGQLLLNPRHYE